MWKIIPNYTKYEISTSGDVRVASTGKPIKATRMSNGYLQAGLFRDSDERLVTTLLHPLVLAAHRRARKSGEVTRHLNGNPSDNRLENLEWGSQRENMKDAISHGTYKSNWPKRRGEKAGTAKLSDEDVCRIREASLFGAKTRDLSSTHGVTLTYINMLKRGEWRV